jgi:hypothetical protein
MKRRGLILATVLIVTATMFASFVADSSTTGKYSVKPGQDMYFQGTSLGELQGKYYFKLAANAEVFELELTKNTPFEVEKTIMNAKKGDWIQGIAKCRTYPSNVCEVNKIENYNDQPESPLHVRSNSKYTYY